MFSDMSCSPEVMNRFTPSMCQEPSSCSTALVRPAPTSEPASGSVRTMVEPHCRSTASCAIRFWTSLPSSYRIPAKAGPEEYIHTAGLAPRTSSAYDQIRDGGAVVPPMASGRPRRQYSESMKAW
ncbi:hypothetical protein GCM10020295_40620 [Streptomyces cinereospinus]